MISLGILLARYKLLKAVLRPFRERCSGASELAGEGVWNQSRRLGKFLKYKVNELIHNASSFPFARLIRMVDKFRA